MIHLKGNILAPLGVIFISCSRLALIFFRSILSAHDVERNRALKLLLNIVLIFISFMTNQLCLFCPFGLEYKWKKFGESLNKLLLNINLDTKHLFKWLFQYVECSKYQVQSHCRQIMSDTFRIDDSIFQLPQLLIDCLLKMTTDKHQRPHCSHTKETFLFLIRHAGNRWDVIF